VAEGFAIFTVEGFQGLHVWEMLKEIPSPVVRPYLISWCQKHTIWEHLHVRRVRVPDGGPQAGTDCGNGRVRLESNTRKTRRRCQNEAACPGFLTGGVLSRKR
jgi:hypothetical protein